MSWSSDSVASSAFFMTISSHWRKSLRSAYCEHMMWNSMGVTLSQNWLGFGHTVLCSFSRNLNLRLSDSYYKSWTQIGNLVVGWVVDVLPPEGRGLLVVKHVVEVQVAVFEYVFAADLVFVVEGAWQAEYLAGQHAKIP